MMSLEGEAMRTEYSTRVDDHRFPFGHQHRAGGLWVEARVEWKDGSPFATMTEARGMSEDAVLQSDIAEALAEIEQQARYDLYLRACDIAGSAFDDSEGTLVERLKAAIAWQNRGTEGDLTKQDRQQLRDLLAFVQ
jgi:hypothetical protein